MSRSTSPLTNGQLLERVASAQGRTRSGRVVFLKFSGCMHVSRQRCVRRSGPAPPHHCKVPIELPGVLQFDSNNSTHRSVITDRWRFAIRGQPGPVLRR